MSAEQIFADTNLFLRYLTNDIPEQADAFERMLRRAAAGEITLIRKHFSRFEGLKMIKPGGS
jgi:hypothetical protein